VAAEWFAPVDTDRSWFRVGELAEAQGERMQALAGALENELDAGTSTAQEPRRGGRVRA
jgi:hypothetical protein